MKQIEHFISGKPGEEIKILPRLRWPIPSGVTQAYVEACTEPGEVVLVPYCQGSVAIREVLAAERRAMALNFDPALILAVQAALAPPSARELDAAVARLGDNLKQGVPLRQYLSDLYATTCPACQRRAVVDYFIWDREQGAPIAKHLHCPACAWNGQTGVDAEDRERLDEIPVRAMHYHYVLDRVAPRQQADAFRTRLELLLELYSSRNLYALAELTLRIEGLFPTGPVNRTLKAYLLDCLDRCSSLAPLPGRRTQRRTLSRPARFLERNVWWAFEEAVTRFRNPADTPVSGLAATLEAFQAPGEKHVGFVGHELVRDLPRLLPPRSIRLILTSPPLLDSAAWSLSYLWGAWLLGAEAVTSMRPLLRQRTPDPAWYARVMAGSFRKLGGLLRDDGRLVLVLTNQQPAVIEALLLAAGSARLGVVSLVQRGPDYRLEMVPTIPQSVSITDTSLEAQIQATAVQAAVETIQARGEPVTRRVLHTAMQRRLAETGLLSKTLEMESDAPSPMDLIAEQVNSALEDPALERLPNGGWDQELWWLADPVGTAPPLCDRVEVATHQILQDTPLQSETDVVQAVHAQFPGPLTPSVGLVETCLQSLGHEVTPDLWQLRPEDLPDARRAERQTIIKHLLTLGQRLGYGRAPRDPFDAAWFEGEQVRAVFVVHWQAALSEALALSGLAGEANPYLVIPGGRAALLDYKLAHNPLWQRKVDAAGWRFIKYRHVRQLVGQPEVDEYALRTIVGLDPIVEQEGAQIPLF